jgi:transcriptional regulator GlxA family with amidase domain
MSDPSERRVDPATLDGFLRRFLQESQPDFRSLPRDLTLMLSCVHSEAFDPELNVQTIRRRCNLRNNNVLTRFRSALGRSLHTYLLDLRLEAAQRLLAASDIEVYRIASALGFLHPETFHRIFRKRFSLTPHQFRLAAGRDRLASPDEEELPGVTVKKIAQSNELWNR